ncbi:MAG: hypothetical protein IKQ37_05665 [Bacteroidaceae bacterium]|nr:hypothetical protein [Bacteroidaceae bacterium]
MSETIIPKTKKECFALLDEMLSDEDKRAIVGMKDVFQLHFTLGLWIRNHWLYPQSEEEREALLKDFGKDAMFCHPDDDSMVILETYRKYLKRKKRVPSP